MRRKIGCILLLAFQAVWLNVILPGHTRGVVSMGGDSCHATSGGCCPKPMKGTDPLSSSKETPEKRAGNCAICFFAARVTPPPVIHFEPPKLELLEIAEIPACPKSPSLPPLLTHDDRGPPAA